MGIRCQCPNGHTLNLKSYLAGKRGICPECKAKFIIPLHSSPSDSTLTGGTDPALESVSIQTASSQTPAEAATPADTTITKAGPSARSESSPVRQSVATAAPAPTAGPPPVTPVSQASATSSNGARPAAMSSEPTWYVRLESGDQFGPANAKTLQRWADEGRIPATSLLWREGWDEWHKADTVLSGSPVSPAASDVPASVSPSPAAGGSSSQASASSWAEQDFPLLDDEPHIQTEGRHTAVTLRQRRRRGSSRRMTATAILLLLLAVMVPALALVVFR